MRNSFVGALRNAAREDERIMLLAGDLGFSVLEGFRADFPGRFFNMGISEANMVGAASGMALCGKKPYVYSIVPFATMRCYEQIRNDICYQNVDAKVVGIGGGLSYGNLGPTHHSREDIAIMRALPNMAIVCPGDPIETELMVKESVKWSGPLYIRLGKGHDPIVHAKKPDIAIGRALEVRKGNDAAIISTGNMLANAVAAAGMLESHGISTRVISMHTVKPLDEAAVLEAAKETKAVFTLEEHSIVGGLGSSVSELLAEKGIGTRFFRLGLRDRFESVVGKQDFLRRVNGIDPDSIAGKVMQVLKEP